MWVLENYNDNESLILFVNEKDEVSIKDIAYEIAKNLNRENNLIFNSNHSYGQYKKTYISYNFFIFGAKFAKNKWKRNGV
jgi:GDP-L-fucose synthase